MVALSVDHSSNDDRYLLYPICHKELVKKIEGIEGLWQQRRQKENGL